MALLLSNCQRKVVLNVNSAGATNADLSVSAPDSVVVRGKIFPPRDTIKTLKNFQVEFRRRTNSQAIELIIDSASRRTGRYQVYLKAGQVYQARLVYTVRNCEVETQEVFVSRNHSTQVKNFYLSYPDSTAYGGCLTGFTP
ncbi:hypothetical protein [Hymenobacter metallilatus]|uniref:Uncharacterized protein n=1 Tax=Hymenobacter metallilatus TaxID=2493666 RepID=A0A3R9NTD7_9BACT|nr:hypothetical protein [Hymenobacter metallilatus]RSK37263.1 hypothetical protein EI290_00995 [Hymenobacter metallilatus]